MIGTAVGIAIEMAVVATAKVHGDVSADGTAKQSPAIAFRLLKGRS